MSSPQSADAADPPAVEEKPEGTSEASDAPTEKTSSSSPSKAATPAAASSSPAKKAEPKPFVYDPNKITLKFIFANRDGVHVILECNPTDTVGEVKGALLSMWPEGEIFAWFVHEPVLSSFCTLFPFTHTSKQSILTKTVAINFDLV